MLSFLFWTGTYAATLVSGVVFSQRIKDTLAGIPAAARAEAKAEADKVIAKFKAAI